MRTKWKTWLQIRAPGFSQWVCIEEGSEKKCRETFDIFKKDGSTVKLGETQTRYHDSVSVKEEKAPSEFRKWYDEYPRKKNPTAAERAYDSVLRRGTTHQQLMDALVWFKREKKDTDPEFIPYPASYLNSGGYLSDEFDQEEAPVADFRKEAWLANKTWLDSWGINPHE